MVEKEKTKMMITVGLTDATASKLNICKIISMLVILIIQNDDMPNNITNSHGFKHNLFDLLI